MKKCRNRIKNIKVKCIDEVGKTQYAFKNKSNPLYGMPTDFFHPIDDRRLMTFIQIKKSMT